MYSGDGSLLIIEANDIVSSLDKSYLSERTLQEIRGARKQSGSSQPVGVVVDSRWRHCIQEGRSLEYVEYNRGGAKTGEYI